MPDRELRWIQRFSNYKKAFLRLQEGVALSQKRALSKLEVQGLIQGFEYTFELSWKTLKDYLEYMQVKAKFPREVIKSAFQYELIEDGDIWMDMLEKRNLMAHTYDEENATLAYQLITDQYGLQLEKLFHLLEEKLGDE